MSVERMLDISRKNRCTQLGIGPMSENCVLASIELAARFQIPLMLIASRRQIECEEQGGGYVNSWNTRTFAEFVRKRDPHGFVILCRDHGGPWQNNEEVAKKMSLKEAMESAKHSFAEDIKAGFEVIHIDPSVNLKGHPTRGEIVDRVKELFEFCGAEASRLGKKVYYEFGKEEQGSEIEGEETFVDFVQEMTAFSRENNLPKPLFVVGQTGTKVFERRNVGSFEAGSSEIQISKLVEACNKHGVRLKAHNVDYLSNGGLRLHTKLGVHAVNVAPEFGVGETLEILSICETLGLRREAEKFLALAYESRKWEKWMLPNSVATDREKAIIAGHYVFATEPFKELKEQLKRKCHSHNVDLGQSIKEKLKRLVSRYLVHFNLIPN